MSTISIEKLIEQFGKPKAILLDWDNTLANSWPIIFRALNITFKEMGKDEWSYEDVINGREKIHHSLRESFPAIFGEHWEKAKEIYYKNFLAVHLDEIKLLDGAQETLEELKKLNIYLAIVSNKTGQYLRDELNHLKIDHYFHKIIGATDAKKDKPHAEPLYMALHASNIHQDDYPQNVWMVGDSRTDIEAAISANCLPVIFGDADVTPYFSKTKIGKINDHKHFVEILKALNN